MRFNAFDTTSPDRQGQRGRPAALSEAEPFHPELFKAAFRRHAAGVAVVTVGGDRPTGFTATSVASLSADPPLLTFNLATTSSSWPAVERAEFVAIHLLAQHQSRLATVFATSGIDRLAEVDGWTTGRHGTPLLPDALARLTARVHQRVVVAGQAVVIAEVVAAGTHDEAAPLLYHDRRFTRLT